MEVSPLPVRELGRTGLEVTWPALGGAGLGGTPDAPGYGSITDEQAIATVRRAIDRGINFIDTSPLYGQSQRRLGLALQDGYREKIILCTKAGTHPVFRGYSGEIFRQSVEDSLRLLKTDYLDILLVHDPRDLTEVLAPDGALSEMLKMKEEGLVHFLGMGVRSHELHRELIATGQTDVLLTYLDYNLISQTATEDLLPFASENGIGILNGSPLYMGLLSGRDPRQVERERGWKMREAEVALATRMWEWCRGRGVSLQALALQFCMKEPRISTCLVGAKSPEEVDQNIEAVQAEIPSELWDLFEAEFMK